VKKIKMDEKQFHLRMSYDMWLFLKTHSAEKNLTMKECINLILEKYMIKNPKKGIDAR
jgi:hypothetical protein